MLFVILIFNNLNAGNGLSYSTINGLNERLEINPDFKLKRLSTGIVILSKTTEKGQVIKHEFEGFYAEVLLAAFRKQSFKTATSLLSKKYFMTFDECRRELKHAIHILQEWEILMQDKQIL